MSNSSTCQENDSLGTRSFPAVAYWGVHTARAVENLRSLALVKIAAAKAIAKLGVLDQERVSFIATEVQALLVPEKLTRNMRLEE